MYKAVVQFTDLQDHNHKYLPGETFPRAGLEVSKARLEELSTNKNRRGKPMIELIEEAPKKAQEKQEGEETKNTPTEGVKPKDGAKKAVSKSKAKKPEPTEEKPKRVRKKKDAE